LVEPSGAVSLAGLLKEKKIFKNKKIAVVISGGNVDPNKLPFN
jgi:threonine dehydratase